MDTDTTLVLGLIIGALSIPSIMSALSEGRVPRLGTVLLLAAGVMVVIALNQKPNGYDIADIPHAFARVFGALVN